MNEFGQEFLLQSRKFLLGEFLPKIELSIAKLSDEQIWWRANEESNSIGNLLLHLAGNVRQWIVSGIGGAEDRRFRQGEFDERAQISRGELMSKLRQTVEEACEVLKNFDADKLLEKRTIQGREIAVMPAVYHVVEHFAMHTGQIILIAKSFAGDMNFYENAGGNTRPNWESPAI